MPENDLGLRWRQLIVRAAGLDPDGRCQPMKPAHDAKREVMEEFADFDRAERDKALRHAIYQPARPWW